MLRIVRSRKQKILRRQQSRRKRLPDIHPPLLISRRQNIKRPNPNPSAIPATPRTSGSQEFLPHREPNKQQHHAVTWQSPPPGHSTTTLRQTPLRKKRANSTERTVIGNGSAIAILKRKDSRRSEYIPGKHRQKQQRKKRRRQQLRIVAAHINNQQRIRIRRIKNRAEQRRAFRQKSTCERKRRHPRERLHQNDKQNGNVRPRHKKLSAAPSSHENGG